MKDGVSKMVGDKVVCKGWCVKDGECDQAVCARWCVTVCERWCVTKWCDKKDGVSKMVCDKDGV